MGSKLVTTVQVFTCPIDAPSSPTRIPNGDPEIRVVENPRQSVYSPRVPLRHLGQCCLTQRIQKIESGIANL